MTCYSGTETTAKHISTNQKCLTMLPKRTGVTKDMLVIESEAALHPTKLLELEFIRFSEIMM